MYYQYSGVTYKKYCIDRHFLSTDIPEEKRGWICTGKLKYKVLRCRKLFATVPKNKGKAIV